MAKKKRIRGKRLKEFNEGWRRLTKDFAELADLRKKSADMLRGLLETEAHKRAGFETWEAYCIDRFGQVPDENFHMDESIPIPAGLGAPNG